jgi:hypothetical protein
MMHGEMVWVAPAIMADEATTAYTPGSYALANRVLTTSPYMRPKDPDTVRRGRKMPQGMGIVRENTMVTNLTTKKWRREVYGCAP